MELILNNKIVELVHEQGNWKLIKDEGFSAVQMMVAAAGACGMYVFNSIMSNSGIEGSVKGASVSYEVDETIRAHPLKSISIHYKVVAKADHRDRIERVVKLVHKSCPVMQSMNPNIEVIETIEYE